MLLLRSRTRSSELFIEFLLILINMILILVVGAVQPFVSNCFSFVWTIYLTYMAGKRGSKFSPTDDMEEIV